ncbi:prephenate dehydratase [Pontibacillus marinus]|uniref:Prephenate dehydratase n=1 Tax=Pontibacillus marinus BH030004 = DSM 16465 TaxID=1385511 RepID=A0A0A5I6N5_9BACI|nr:prephenate dehydratase [Pontibacillus marinus]KGX91482.1 prephenate dehydratase [Pontibacillus marinus BH030004 = DSM 16465]
MSKIGYLGPKGTFTNIAVSQAFPNNELEPFSTIPSCMDAVKHEEIQYAVLPWENAIEGSVNLTIDYLVNQKLTIVGEIIVPIRQHLMVHPQNRDCWESFEAVYSHSHAISQCHQYLYKHLPHIEFSYKSSTSAAAKHVKENPEQRIAAIGNELAASEYGLDIIKHDIHDFDNNHTRFVILSKQATDLEVKDSNYLGDRTTLMITLPTDHYGALHQVLSAFAWRKLNLSKIESRPMKTGLGNYFFIIDIEMKYDQVLIPGAITEIEALGCKVTTLGSYPYYGK